MFQSLHASRRLSLSAPGTGAEDPGGPMGGGGAASFVGDRPLPSSTAREAIEKKLDPAPADSGKEKAGEPEPKPEEKAAPGEPAKKETPAPPDSEAARKAAEKGKETPPAKKEEPPTPPAAADTTEKRLRDTQAALHKAIAEGKSSAEKLAELQAKLDLVTKYVDMDKLTAHEKEQAEKLLDEPVTLRQLQESLSKIKPESTPAEQPAAGASPEEIRKDQEAWVGKYLESHPHMAPHFESRAAVGVAQKIGAEHPDWTLDQIGEEVSKHFLDLESGIEKRVSERLTKTRTSLSEAGTPQAGSGTPAGSTPEDETPDTAGAEVARRRAVLAGQRRFLN